MGTVKDYSEYFGTKFGRWTIIGDGQGRHKWLCKCDCGTVKEVDRYCIMSGGSVSCGCYRADLMRGEPISHEKKVLKSRYKGIKRRCYSPTHSIYFKYGAKGIGMCDEWKNSFESFYQWAIANGFREDLTIDRIDCKGNYCPENCRWVDKYVQANNKSNVKKYLYNDQMLTIPQISELCGIDANSIYHRIKVMKWSVERATTTPVEVGRNQFTELNDEKLFEYKGEKLSKNDIIKITKLPEKTVRERLCRGWSVEDTIEVPFGKQKEKWRRERNV